MSIMRQDLAENMEQTAIAKGLKLGEFSLESDIIFSLLITYILNAMDMDKAKREERLKVLEQQILMIVMRGRL